MGLDTNTKIDKMFIGTSKPKDVWVGTKLAKEVYVGTNKVYNAPVHIVFTPSQYERLRQSGVLYKATHSGCTGAEGSISSSTYLTSTYAHPQSINGKQLGGYGLDVGYGAKVTWSILGTTYDYANSNYGVFARNIGQDYSITYKGNNVTCVNNAFFKAEFDPIALWDIRPVTKKVFSTVRLFTTTNGLSINSAAFPDLGQDRYVSITPVWDGYNGDSLECYPGSSTSVSGEFQLPQSSSGYLEIQVTGLFLGNVGRGKSLAYKVAAWNNPNSVGVNSLSDSKKKTTDGYQFYVYFGPSYGSSNSYNFTNLWSDDDGNVFVNAYRQVGFTSGTSSDYSADMAGDAGYGGAIYVGSYHNGYSDSINNVLADVGFNASVHYG
jgi:hypothetical protein